MWFKSAVFLLVISFTLASCNEGKTKGPNSTGRGSEIIVVCSKKLWNGPVGDTVRGVFTRSMEGLPEGEPEYTLINISEKDFSKFLQTHRNILVINITPEVEKGKVETLRNVWSHPQRVIKVKASSDTGFINLFARHSEAVRELFNQNERARFSAQNALSRDFEIEKTLADTFGIKMVVSKDFYKAKKMRDFVWLRSEATTMSLGILIYTFPYKDTSQINPKAVLAVRDRYTKLYIPGSVDGSYMTTEREYYEPVTRKILFKGLYALETRGLWRTEGDFMGGPFVNYTIVDAPRQRVVVFDGYVYYPNKSKRNYVRQLESIIWGAEFIDFKETASVKSK